MLYADACRRPCCAVRAVRAVHAVQVSSWAYIMYIVMDNAGVAAFLFFVAVVLLQAYFVVGGVGRVRAGGPVGRRCLPRSLLSRPVAYR